MKIFIGEPPEDGNVDQEVNIQVDEWDTWALDYTLAQIIVPSLIKFRDTMRCYPESFVSLANLHSMKSDEEWSEEDNEESMDAWRSTIDSMIWSFKEILKDESLRSEETDKKIQYGLDLFGKYYTHLWD